MKKKNKTKLSVPQEDWTPPSWRHMLGLRHTPPLIQEPEMGERPRTLRRARLGAGLSALLLTLTVAIMGVGFFVVDYNTRSTGLASQPAMFAVAVKDDKADISAMGKEFSVALDALGEVPSAVEKLRGALPLPLRLPMELILWAQALVRQL